MDSWTMESCANDVADVGVAQVKIPGRMFPVEDFYFEDCSPTSKLMRGSVRSDLWVC